MTEQITVPRETWDAIREALKHGIREMNLSGKAKECMPLHHAITAANAVSEPQGLFVDLIASHGPEFVDEIAAIEPVGINGLTEAETSASMSVMGLSKPQAQGEWKHCSPELLASGVSCRDTPRRPCECEHGGSHDHWIAHPQATEPAGYDKDQIEKAVRVLVGVATFGSNSKRQDGAPTPNRLRQLESAKYLHSLVSNEEFEAEYAFTLGHFAAVEHSTEPEGWEELTSAAREVLDYTEAAHRPPVRDVLEAGRMVRVRLHALASLHDALNMLAAAPEAKQ